MFSVSVCVFLLAKVKIIKNIVFKQDSIYMQEFGEPTVFYIAIYVMFFYIFARIINIRILKQYLHNVFVFISFALTIYARILKQDLHNIVHLRDYTLHGRTQDYGQYV